MADHNKTGDSAPADSQGEQGDIDIALLYLRQAQLNAQRVEALTREFTEAVAIVERELGALRQQLVSVEPPNCEVSGKTPPR